MLVACLCVGIPLFLVFCYVPEIEEKVGGDSENES